MPRKKAQPDAAADGHGTNGYNPEKLQSLLSDIDTADDKLASIKSDYMNRCKSPRANIAAVYEAAGEAGIPVKAFKTVVKNHRLERKLAANVARLEDDDADAYDRLVEALGDFVDLPLGAAAADRARPGSSALDSLA